MSEKLCKLYLSTVIAIHHLVLFTLIISIPILLIYEPIWVSIPLSSWIIHLGCTRNDCPLTKLGNHFRKKLLFPEIKGFISHYYKKPYQNLMWRIERNYLG